VSINAFFVGNVGKAETKSTAGGALLVLSVATREWSKEGGESTTWVRCAVFGKRAEGLAKVVEKGSTVAVRGTLTVREYEGQNGKGFSVECRADDVELVGGRPQGRGDGAPRQEQRRGGYRAPSSGQPQPQQGDAYEGDYGAGQGDDDLNF
jgi:single-strand DNA-binding protein